MFIAHNHCDPKVIPLTEPKLLHRYLNPIYVIVSLLGCIFLTLLLNVGDTLASGYVNYTSYEYKIQFQYPTDWVQSEKLSSHDKGADISVSKLSKVQPPSFTTIDGQMAGTFISYSRHRFGDTELETVEQFWLTYVGSVDYYLMAFIAPIQSFSNPDNVMIRNHLVKSVKILDVTDMAKSKFP